MCMGQIATIGGRIAGITITAAGAVVEGTPLEHTYEECMRQISAAERACKFALGDLMIAASGHYGEKYARWAEVTGMELQTLQDIASTCRRVPHHLRRTGTLSFTHHREVASLPAPEQEKWLGIAEAQGVSSDRLRKSIQLGRVATASDMGRGGSAQKAVPTMNPADMGYESVHPHVNRLVVYLSKKEREGEYEDMSAEELYRFHLDLLPVINRWGKVISRMLEKNQTADLVEALEKDLRGAGLAIFSSLN